MDIAVTIISTLSLILLCTKISKPIDAHSKRAVFICGRYLWIEYKYQPIELFKYDKEYYKSLIVFVMIINYAIERASNLENVGFFRGMIIFLCVSCLYYPLFICVRERTTIAKILCLPYICLIILNYIHNCLNRGDNIYISMYIIQPICAIIYTAIKLIEDVGDIANQKITAEIVSENIKYSLDVLHPPTQKSKIKLYNSPRIAYAMVVIMSLAYMVIIYYIFHITEQMNQVCFEKLGCEPEKMRRFSQVIQIIIPIISILYFIYEMHSLLKNYYKDIALLRRGNYVRVPQGIVPGDVINFIGYQIIYGFGGFIFLISVLVFTCWSIFIAINNQDIIQFIKNYIQLYKLTWPTLYALISSISVAVGISRVLMVSTFLVRYVRIFAHIEYIFMFISIFRGLIIFIWCKLIIPIVMLAFTSFRIDQPSAGRFDFGYRAYISMIITDHEYNNPIKNTFIFLLQKKDNLLNAPSLKSRRMRNKWLVAYTLLNNTQLIKYRRGANRVL